MRRLAAGGQAITYLALAHKVNEESGQVVLKEFVLPVRGGIEIRKRALENVEHEAKLLQKLNNERIVKLIDCFVDRQKAYLVLEYIDGKSLRNLVNDNGALDEAEAVRLGIEMCSVLDYLHTLEPAIVHRDFTPENLLLRSTGELALIDFNVAEQLESNETKTMVGKHCYVSPEQFRGKATWQSDIYSCGCTLYWLLTAKDPEPISISQPINERQEMSFELNDIVARATAIDTSNRFASAKMMKAELEAILASSR
ncbi:serine/threonine protein kinase [bacterium]|nr:serine/threonine protein kinase [bacterium]MBP9808837.1 serine/threonine protein kinase [bacterium]